MFWSAMAPLEEARKHFMIPPPAAGPVRAGTTSRRGRADARLFIEPVALHLAVQRREMDPERLRRASLVALDLLQHTVAHVQQDAAAAVSTAADALEYRAARIVGYQTRFLDIHAISPGCAHSGQATSHGNKRHAPAVIQISRFVIAYSHAGRRKQQRDLCKIGPFHATFA